jgi:hypothetical protein
MPLFSGIKRQRQLWNLSQPCQHFVKLPVNGIANRPSSCLLDRHTGRQDKGNVTPKRPMFLHFTILHSKLRAGFLILQCPNSYSKLRVDVLSLIGSFERTTICPFFQWKTTGESSTSLCFFGSILVPSVLRLSKSVIQLLIPSTVTRRGYCITGPSGRLSSALLIKVYSHHGRTLIGMSRGSFPRFFCTPTSVEYSMYS